MKKITYRSKGGKTVILYFNNGVMVTGDFFCTEEDLSLIENSLSRCEKPDKKILGVEMEELYEIVKKEYPPCTKLT
ncbi:hypothetical protein [Sulfuracidifex tepidarius]|uniref:hypothetical protein n=1 Tax=Sulfuracidifex tepidarius TaxID=1294262 RepID=UPI0006D0F127|nr:hypothetical protein [Sulfuracidifex tepidarius]